MLTKSDYFYSLPPALIAQQPLAQRSASRLLLVPAAPAPFQDRRFIELATLLRPGDLLVLNDTRVIPARLLGEKKTGGRVELLIERVIDSSHAQVQMRANHSKRLPQQVDLEGGGCAHVYAKEGSFYRVKFDLPLALNAWLQQAGQMPLPPYIECPAAIDAQTQYQTVFARHQGAVAAPTAGLHFDLPLLAQLRERGIATAMVTLHVGAGTFQPVRCENLDQHLMHREWCQVDQTVIDQIQHTRQQGRRVIAVGTTVLRALESAVQAGVLQPLRGDTQLFIRPGFRITTVDALLTNFHLPESTLLMLVAAFAGYQRMMDAYHHAIAQRYRFFSFGDAMLIAPEGF